MKTLFATLFCLLFSLALAGQEITKIDEVKVTPPKFTGTQNFVTTLATINDYVARHFEYPQTITNFKPEGTVVVRFEVMPGGILDNFTVENSVSKLVDAKVIEILKSTEGMWLPGENNGKAVAMEHEFALAIKTSLNNHKSPQMYFLERAKNEFAKANEKLIVKGKAKRALKNYDNGIRYRPKEEGLYLMRGLCRYEMNDVEGAYRDWEKAKELCGVDFLSDFKEDITHLKGYKELAEFLKSE